ncbi:hypothetical protein DIPPA_05678 [Diplonema papillatum]|nr:hypothetical protein DIPPA_05678 [Diplonema papillatum]
MPRLRGALLSLVALLVATTSASNKYGDDCEHDTILSDCGEDLGCVNSTCECCSFDADCQSDRLSGADEGNHFHLCEELSENESLSGDECDRKCKHKDFFPPNKWDITCLLVVMFCVMIAASAGIGGGGMIVPALIFLANFSTDRASPLSSVTITGGAIANYIAYSTKKHPDYPRVAKPLIEYNVSLMIMPSILAGTSVGTLLDKVLPLWLITALLFVLLLALSIRTSIKAYRCYKTERMRKRQQAMSGDSDVNTGRNSLKQELLEGQFRTQTGEGEVTSSNQVKQFPVIPLVITAGAWMATAAAALLKGGKGVDSLIPAINCGNVGYWSVSAVFILFMAVLTVVVRWHMLKEVAIEHRKLGVDSPSLQEEFGGSPAREGLPPVVQWTPKNTILFPVICFLCGICAGMLGIGGGMVVGPLLVELGLHPKVVAATSGFAVLVSASAASFQFLVMGLLYPEYSLVYFGLGFLATLIGQRVMDAAIKKLDLESAIVIVIAGVTVAATIALGYKSVSQLVIMFDRDQDKGFRSLCD